MWYLNAINHCDNLYQYRYSGTELYVVIAEQELQNKEQHFKEFIKGVKYCVRNPDAEVYYDFKVCKASYGFSEPPFYQGFSYAQLGLKLR